MSILQGIAGSDDVFIKAQYTLIYLKFNKDKKSSECCVVIINGYFFISSGVHEYLRKSLFLEIILHSETYFVH